MTWDEAARALGIGRSSFARLLADPTPAAPPASRLEPAAAPTSEGRRAAALAALDRALASDDARAVAAAREVLAETRREQAIAAWDEVEQRRARALVREQSRRLGVNLRARIDAGTDPELADLYRRAASTLASDADVDALDAWITAHPEVLEGVADDAAA